MEILQHLIKDLNKEQVRFFKLYAKRINSDGGDRKDILLFDYIRKSGDEYDQEKIFKKLYDGKDKNAFYRLKNRLMHELNKSLTLQHFDEEEMVYIFRLLALVKFYSNRNQVKTAYYFLKKAEAKAMAIESYELLDIIYGEFIRLSHELVSVNPEDYIARRKENLQQLNDVRTIDDILAAVSFRLKVTQNYSQGENPVLHLLETTLHDYSNDKNLQKSPKFRFKIYNAVSQVLLQKREYEALEEYLLGVYKSFNKEKLFTKNNHDAKLQMLTYLVNALFKNNKLKQSLQYAEELKKAMEEFHHMLYDKYIFFYYNSLVINYSKLNKDKAISILEDLKDNEKMKSNSFYQVFIYANLFLLWFEKHNFQTAAKNLTKLSILDGYKDTDPSLRLKIGVAEMVTRYELNDELVFKSKITQLSKEFKELLTKKEHVKEKDFIVILRGLAETENYRKDKSLLAKIKSFIASERSNKGSEDTELFNYGNWLNDKIRV